MSEASPARRKERRGKILSIAFAVILLTVAGFVIGREIQRYGMHQILHEVWSIPRRQTLLALGLTAICYLALSLYDHLALRFTGHKLSLGKVTAASFVAHAYSNSIGLVNLAGGTVRYRFYSAWGISATDVAKIVAVQVSSTYLGFMLVCGLAFAIAPPPIPPGFALPLAVGTRALGFVLIAAISTYAIFIWKFDRPIKVFRWTLTLPAGKTFLFQMAVSCLDWALTGTVLYALLPQQFASGYGAFLGIYLMAQLIAAASHVPGGIGVLEAVVIFFLQDRVPEAQVIGMLLAYRVIYYFIPLVLGTIGLGGFEIWRARKGVAPVATA